MPWLELSLTIHPRQADIFEAALLAAGALSVTYQDEADQPILEPALGEAPLWQSTRLSALFDADINTRATELLLRAQCGEEELPPLRWNPVEDKDWQREWMRDYHPIQCGDHLWICPSWLAPPDPSAINVLLDPGLAFGTGTHPTTLLCLQWLARQDLSGLSIVDYGCGSGILAIAALLSGAARVTAVDIDPQALQATRENARRNKIDADRIQTYLPGECPPQQADLVFANILAGPLIELAAELTQLTANGGQLCLSGILANQADTVTDAYAERFNFDEAHSLEQWVQLSARRGQDHR